MAIQLKQRSVLPGFGLTMGFTLLYLSLLVLIPLAGLVFKSATINGEQFYAAVTDARVVASYKLTFGASLVAAPLECVVSGGVRPGGVLYGNFHRLSGSGQEYRQMLSWSPACKATFHAPERLGELKLA